MESVAGDGEVNVYIHISLISTLVGGDRRLGGPQSQSGGYGEEKNLAPNGIRSPPARSSIP
jgi:hypothetical protein